MIIQMLTTAADEHCILEKSKFYDLPKREAEVLINPVGKVYPDGPDKPGKEIRVAHAIAAPDTPRNKITRIPGSPNPEDCKSAWSQESDDDE